MTEEIEKLLEHSIGYAKELLIGTGESYPFGAYLDTIDNVHPLEMEIDKKNIPQIGFVVEKLKQYCEEEMAGEKMNGYCMAYEVKMNLDDTSEPIDAIAFEMKYKEETGLSVYYLPFSFDKNNEAVFEELFAVKS